MKTKDLIGLVFAVVLLVLVVVAFINDRDGDDDATGSSATPAAATMDRVEQRLREKRVIEVCEMSVRQQLRDPDSAQFREESGQPDTPEGVKWLVIGEVNARNGFGGMVGYKAFTCVADYDADTEGTRGRATILGVG
ncbi:MAG: hypothetical protein QM662_18745 [Gordonia sp. (in: high G+C Gram-positive bacteria)]